MKQMGFYYDPTVCIGCRACQAGCKEEHKLPAGDFFRRVSPVNTEGKWTFFSGACNHCQDPACVVVCPNGALYKDADGTVQHDRTRCIGCGRCVHSCPYKAITLSSITGYAQKCDSCAARRAQGRNPICVDACPTRALQFGDLEDLKAKYGDHGAVLPFLPDPAITCPSLLLGGTAPAAKAEAQKLPAAEAPSPSDNTGHIVILGSGAAAVSAAKEIRSRTPHAKITMISREQRLPYARPMLSKGLLKSFAVNRYPIVDEAWLKDNLNYICGEITALDANAHTITLQDSRTVSFDKCIYALGMECFVPPIPGHDLPHVFTLRYDTDLTALRKAMMTARNAVVIGGGITGLELAWEMKKAGLSVTVLDMVDQLLGRILDAHTAANLRTAIEAKGITVDTGVQISTIEENRVLLADGRSYAADLVILSTGYRANTALAKAAGLDADRTVEVDAHLLTSHPDILACGDCTSSSAATWLQSMEQGRIAGANALGCDLCYSVTPEPAMIHTADTSLMVIGDMGKQTGLSYTFRHYRLEGTYDLFAVNPATEGRTVADLTLCLQEDRLCGTALLGDLSTMAIVEPAVLEGRTLEALCDELCKKGAKFHEK